MRRAVTLIELVVVIGIIGVLVSLLLPTVQSARESARRVSCQNRLHNIGIAGQNFVSAHSFFPSNGWGFAWRGEQNYGYGRNQPGGWVYHLLAYVEVTLPESDDHQAAVDQAEDMGLWLFRCPSRPAPLLSANNTEFPPFNAAKLLLVGKSDFAICEGDFITDTRSGPQTYEDQNTYQWIDPDLATGISFQRSEVGSNSITDGLSHTYFVGEKNVCQFNYTKLGDLGYDQSLFSGVDLDLNRWSHVPPAPDGASPGYRQFGSAHPTGFSMSYCDGSVRYLSYSIDYLVHRHGGHRSDGETESQEE